MVKIFILLFSIVLFISTSAAATVSASDVSTTDRLLFASSIEEFTATRNSAVQTGSTLDFESDGCSKVDDKPMGFDFLASCQRHDFGYRNYKLQERRDDTGRQRIDRNFRRDMWDACANADNKVLDYTYPLSQLVAEAANGIKDLLDFTETNTYNQDQISYDYYDSYFTGYYDNSNYHYDYYGEDLYDGSYYDSYSSYDSVESIYNSGQGSYGDGGEGGFRYSEKVICEIIADTYYYGVTIYGTINGASGLYGTRDNVYFWGMYAAFLSALVFGYGAW